MKKRLFWTFLALLLLLGSQSALAAGGDRDDPLVSLSYVRETFIPAIKNAFSARISGRESAAGSGTTGRIAVSAGGSVALEQGRTFILTSGSARLALRRGSVVNASAGAEAASGALDPNQRYIVCEDSAATVEMITDAVLTVAGTAEVTQGDGKASPFTDVVRGSWYFDDVIRCCERGFIDGMTPTTYEPTGTLTLAQCVKLAACMHQFHSEGAVAFEAPAPGEPWYSSYVDYALENGMIEREFDDYNAPVVRREFVEVFYNALPETEYARINKIADGAIPDVPGSDGGAKEVYAFYRAGILAGYGEADGMAAFSFGPDRTITRAEVATIMNRMFDKDARVEFTIK
ncbi:MAG: S-layer homology domain-containing protein [Butyricicoccus sp.]|nr:S-layer homology domain-containing protein [Butyricicoccus sp.]